MLVKLKKIVVSWWDKLPLSKKLAVTATIIVACVGLIVILIATSNFWLPPILVVAFITYMVYDYFEQKKQDVIAKVAEKNAFMEKITQTLVCKILCIALIRNTKKFNWGIPLCNADTNDIIKHSHTNGNSVIAKFLLSNGAYIDDVEKLEITQKVLQRYVDEICQKCVDLPEWWQQNYHRIMIDDVAIEGLYLVVETSISSGNCNDIDY